MLASDVLPPRTVSSRGMSAMLKRLETDSPGRYTFKLLPPSSLNSSFLRKHESVVARTRSGSPLSPCERGASEASGVCTGKREEPQPQSLTRAAAPTISPASRENGEGKGGNPDPSDWSWLPRSARISPTGLALLYAKTTGTDLQPRLAVAPPFPIQSEVQTTDRDTLLKSIDPPLHIAIILIRYGYVAIAIAHDETIVVSKTDTRWVPNRHRAGGQSANRFKRSREKWAREFFDKSARLATERFCAYQHRIDWLIFGGDQHVINQFLQRANLPDKLADRILSRRLNTFRPNRNALKDAVRQAWSSTVYELAN